MHTKEKKGNGVKLALAVSMVGLGIVTSKPVTTNAMGIQNVVSTPLSDEQTTNTLSDLEIQGLQLDQTFLPNVNEYTAHVDNSVQNISILARSDNAQAKITIKYQDQVQNVTNGAAGPFSLQPGDNIFVITVDDGTDEPKTYTLTVTQTTNTLSDLGIQGLQLDQTFSSNLNDYTAHVDNSVQNISILAQSDNAQAKITIKYQDQVQTLTNGAAGPFSLEPGENTFEITVDDGTNTPDTYSLTVTRQQAAEPVLQNIKLSVGTLTPAFTEETTDYSVTVPYEAGSITVTPETDDKTATVTVKSGTQVIDTGKPVSIPVGKSDITISVKNADGVEKQYIIHVTREAAPSGGTTGGTTGGTGGSTGGTHGGTTGGTHGGATGGTHGSSKGGSYGSKTGSTPGGAFGSKTGGTHGSPSGASRSSSAGGSFGNGSFQTNSTTVQKPSTALLSSFTVSTGTWDNTFSSNKFTYHLAEASNITSVTLNPILEYSSAAISINGDSSDTIQLVGNQTVIPIVVTRGTDRKTYVLVFDKPVPPASTSTESAQTAADSTVSTTENTVSPPSSNAPSSASTMRGSQGNTKTAPSFWQSIINFFKNLFK